MTAAAVTRELVVHARWGEGAFTGTLRVDSDGMLATEVLPSDLFNPRGMYTVVNTGVIRLIANRTVFHTILHAPGPFVSPGETVEVALGVVRDEPGRKRSVMLDIAEVWAGLLTGTPMLPGEHPMRVTIGGRLVITTVPGDVTEVAVNGSADVGRWETPGDGQYSGAGSGVRDGVAFTEGAMIETRSRQFVASGGEVMERCPEWGENAYAIRRWPGALPAAGLPVQVQNLGTRTIGLRNLTVTLQDQGVGFQADFVGTREEAFTTETRTGKWVSPRMAAPRTCRTVQLKARVEELRRVNGSRQWVEVEPVFPPVHLETVVTGWNGQTIASGWDEATLTVPAGQAARSVQVTVTLNPNRAMRITDLVIEYAFDPPVPRTPGERTAGYGLAPTWAVEAATMRANVPRGAVKMMRHPLMPLGCTVTPVGVTGAVTGACEWINGLFLRLPSGTHRAYWAQDGGAQPVGAGSGEVTRTGLNWGDVETRASVPNIYVPQVQVRIGGVDVTPDVLMAGSGRVTLLGTNSPGLDAQLFGMGRDCVVELDGLGVAWGKVVSVQKTTEEGQRVMDVTFADPIDYHNADVELLAVDPNDPSRPWPLPDGRLAPVEYLQEICERSGLGDVSLANGEAPPAILLPEAAVQEPYQLQGNTVAQELELIANAHLLAPYTDPETQGVYLAPLFGTDVDVPVPVDHRLGLQLGYDLSRGYGVVQVSGTSNSVKAGTKQTMTTVTNQGQEVSTVVVPTGTGGQAFSTNQSGWWPREYSGTLAGRELGFQQFEVIRDSIPKLAAYALRHNGVSLDKLDVDYPGWRSQSKEWTVEEFSAGVPQLTPYDSQGRSRKRVYVIEDRAFNYSAPRDAKESEGGVEIDRIVFRVESPARVRERLKLSVPQWPDDWGPCVTGFKAHINDSGAYGIFVNFFLQFSVHVINESSIAVIPYDCDVNLDLAPSAAVRAVVDEAVRSAPLRPHKKNVVQNPFIEEPPPNGGSGLDPHADMRSHGAKLATALTFQEAMRTRQGSLTYVGALYVKPGDRLVIAGERFLVLDAPRVEITPGDTVRMSMPVAPFGNPLSFDPYATVTL